MIITQTPLRLSFLGGNTDFPDYFNTHGGKVLTSAIDKYVYCIAKWRFDDRIILNYTERESVSRVNEIRHSIIREAMNITGVEKGVEITTLADIPAQGSGLGSSSAVAVGVLNTLHHLQGASPTLKELAEQACDIEINRLKNPIGIQDQYACAFGGLRAFEFTSKTVNTHLLKLDPKILRQLEESLLVFYLGTEGTNKKILTNVKNTLSNKTELLHKNKQLATSGEKALEQGKISEFGKLLDEYWQLKKTLAKGISNSIIDTMYKKAKDAGSFGGKVVGAGGRGFLLLIVDPTNRQTIRQALKDHRELPIKLQAHGTKVIFNIDRS